MRYQLSLQLLLDVAKDWDLTLFDSEARNAPDLKAFGLRRRLHVGPPILYYLVIALDLLLRCTWSLKLSPHLGRIADWEGSIFVIELLEVIRRWIWIFFRVETEWIRNTNVTGLDVDDILLPDYHNHNIQELNTRMMTMMTRGHDSIDSAWYLTNLETKLVRVLRSG